MLTYIILYLFVSSVDEILILNFSLENDKFKMIVKESHFSSYNAKYSIFYNILKIVLIKTWTLHFHTILLKILVIDYNDIVLLK